MGVGPDGRVALGDPAVPCDAGRIAGWNAAPTGGGTGFGAIRIHGLAFLDEADRFRPGAPPLGVVAELPARTEAAISVRPDFRAVAGLDAGSSPARRPRDAHRTVVCRAGTRPGAFRLAIVVAGARCMPLAVTVGGRTTSRWIGFGRRICQARP